MLPDSAAIEPLLADRDALHGWLQRLDQTGSATPDAVRAKVRADYEKRLDGITERLRAHADTIAARLADDRADHRVLSTQLATAETGLAEAQLRHAVGEYDGRRFDEEQRRFSDDIRQHRQGIDAAVERIERMESIHALVTQPVVPVESLAPVVTPVATSPAAAPQPAIVDVAPTPRQLEDRKLEDALLSVFDEPRERDGSAPDFSPLSFRPGNGMPEAPRAPEPRRFAPSAGTPPLGVPEDALPRFSQHQSAPVAERAPSPVASAAPVPTAVEVAAPLAPIAAGGASLDETIFGDRPIVATGADVTQPASRTLRCGECGAMNKPLEWYCEKCGAELTAA